MSLRHPFILRSNQRILPEGCTDDVFIWDIDKTYLNTEFSSMRGLLAIPFELAMDKETVPGATPLLRAIRRGPGPKPRFTPLYFVSGSPVQLRKVIEQKMTLDGVQFDGITFKDQWGFVKHGRPRGVKEQIGYKLRALLLYRREMPHTERWFLFGDDVESDAEVFTLFGKVCAGLRGDELTGRLRACNVHPDDIKNVHEIAAEVPITHNPVEQVFIHLTNKTDADDLATETVIPVRSFLQAALWLAAEDLIDHKAVGVVAESLRRQGRVKDAVLNRQVEEAAVRWGLEPAFVDAVWTPREA